MRIFCSHFLCAGDSMEQEEPGRLAQFPHPTPPALDGLQEQSPIWLFCFQPEGNVEVAMHLQDQEPGWGHSSFSGPQQTHESPRPHLLPPKSIRSVHVPVSPCFILPSCNQSPLALSPHSASGCPAPLPVMPASPSQGHLLWLLSPVPERGQLQVGFHRQSSRH